MSHIDVRTIQGVIPMSRELLDDTPVMDDLYGLVADAFLRGEADRELDRIYGPNTRHRPSRADWWACSRPDRIRRNILANLPPGRPGRFQKASPAATGDTTPTNTP